MTLPRFFLLALVGAGSFLVFTYNRLVSLRNRAANAMSSIDVQLRQRTDLVPKVVAAVKGYLNHEKEVLSRLTELRTRAASGGLSDVKRVALDSEMGAPLQRLMV